MSDARERLATALAIMVGHRTAACLPVVDALDAYLEEREPTGPHDSHTWIWASSEAHPNGQTECAHCEIHIHDVAAYEPCPDAPTDEPPPPTATNPADAPEPHQSEGTGSEALASKVRDLLDGIRNLQSCGDWGAVTEHGDADILGEVLAELARLNDLVRRVLRSRTEREAGERAPFGAAFPRMHFPGGDDDAPVAFGALLNGHVVEVVAIHAPADWDGTVTVEEFQKFWESDQRGATVVPLYLRAPAPRVPEENKKP